MMRPLTSLTAMMVVMAGAAQSGGEMILARRTSARRLMVRVTMVATFVVALLAFANPARAETFPVETTNDSGPSSLRQAIADANATSEADTIVFGLDAGATITLSSTLTVTNPLTIEGHPTRPLTISGNNAVRPFYVQATTLNISDITIANGRVADPLSDATANYGGAIFNYSGRLAIRGGALTDNSGDFSAYRGGAIYNLQGSVSLIDSRVSGYVAAHSGGAIYNDSAATTTLAGSTLSGNFALLAGGAIYNPNPSEVKVTAGSRLEDNGATRGGGIYNASVPDGISSEAARITDSTVVGNFTVDKGGFGGGVYTTGDIVVERSTFSGNAASNRGGGLFADSGNVKVDASTFSGNQAWGNYAGGGIGIWGGNATITNSTLSGNSADSNGGGLYVHDLVTTAPTIRGSIIAGNTAVSGSPDVGGNYTNGGFNIVGGTATQAGLKTDANGKPVLEDNGGPTKTVALAAGSPAIDKGNSFGSATDQRGVLRPSDYGGVPDAQGGDGSDIGAFERRAPATAPDSYATDQRQTLLVDAPGVLANDTAGEGGAATASLISGPEHGELALSPDGSFSYTPDSSYSGTDSFSYAASHGASSGGPATVEITVRDTTAPDAPLITSPVEGARLNVRSFSVSGTAEAGAKIELFEGDASRGTTTAGPDGAWSKTLSAVPDGPHTYRAKATDRAGNASGFSNTRTVIVDTTAPRVKRVVPTENATGIAPGANVSAFFSEAMRPASVSAAVKLYKVGSTTALAATVTYDAATRKAVLNPSANLQRGARYKVVVSTVAKDLAGNRLDQDPSVKGNQPKAWFFTVKN